jgi:hypothetical protein
VAPGQTLRVRWFRNGKRYASGPAVALRGSAGRAARVLAPRVRDGRFRAELWLGGRLAARAAVVKACR